MVMAYGFSQLRFQEHILSLSHVKTLKTTLEGVSYYYKPRKRVKHQNQNYLQTREVPSGVNFTGTALKRNLVLNKPLNLEHFKL